MTATLSVFEHLDASIASIDEQVADLNARIELLRDDVDHLVDVRVDLLKIRNRCGPVESPPAEPPSPPPAVEQAPEEPAAAQPAPSSGSKYDLAEVAALARDAQAAGESMSDYIHEHLAACPSRQMASFLIQQARKAGHDIPRLRANKGGATVPSGRPRTRHRVRLCRARLRRDPSDARGSEQPHLAAPQPARQDRRTEARHERRLGRLIDR